MRIPYFQRYHGRENVVTSNTMLMLSRLYNYNADKFYTMLNTCILQTDETPEISFDLQVVGKNSVPDAIISQKSFKIIVETKLHNQFVKNQLLNHLEQFDREEIKILLTLDPKPMRKRLFDDVTSELKRYNDSNAERLCTPIKHINLTFEQLVTAIEEVVDDRDTEMLAVFEDFKEYCFDEKLIPDGYKWMRAIVARTTFNDNMELNLYYDREIVRFSEHGYIGLYMDKSVRAIGKLVKTVLAKEENGKIVFTSENNGEPTEEEKERIKEAISRSEKYSYDLKSIPHRYFIVEKFYPTDFKKSSKNAIQKSKFFNLADMLGYVEMPSTEQIAKDLDGKIWEQF